MNDILQIALLQDPDCETMPEFGPEDVRGALEGTAHILTPFQWSEVDRWTSSRPDVVVMPYLNGTVPGPALSALEKVHQAGTSLLFLGQLPHRDRWAPTRNFHGHRLDLTAYCANGQVDGLTEFGLELLGEIPDLERFRGRSPVCARTTAFPPDRTRVLFHSENTQMQWEATPGVWVDRLGPRFLGAKLAQIGCMGGEPREVAAGGYPLPWRHDPGLLDRAWDGLPVLLRSLVEALRPRDWFAALELPPLEAEGASCSGTLRLRNLTGKDCLLPDLRICQGGETIFHLPAETLTSGEWRTIKVPLPACCAGIYPVTLSLGNTEEAQMSFRRVEPSRSKVTKPGFGFSTYWAFQNPEIDAGFVRFCHIMKERGCRYVRVNVPWEDVEPEPGSYDWRIPDGLLKVAKDLDLDLQFWMFPITRGATIGDGGVPEWTLKEPAMTHDGRPGLFPSLWSPFYRKHFFAMLNAFTQRYAEESRLERFVFDFGNSDFAYGYFYYVNDLTLFDYSPHERKAFSAYLMRELKGGLKDVGHLYGENFTSEEDIPVPLVQKHPRAWRYYLDFRGWSIREGQREIKAIILQNAPDKLPPDLPGHGAGSIADLSSYHLDSKARHWEEEQQRDSECARLHNAGPVWGGEAWQVGARFREYDDALFQSVRLNSDYFTIPGPDVGVYGDDITRCGFIRRAIQGAERETPLIGIMDRCEWNAFQSLAHVGARMDQPVDLISPLHRYDFSCYRILVLPPNERIGRTNTGGGGGQLLPPDPEWAADLGQAVRKGLVVLIFPETARIGPGEIPHTFVRQALGLEEVGYGDRREGILRFPEGELRGQVRSVEAPGEVLWRTEEGLPILVRQPRGEGSVLLAGWDTEADSLDGVLDPSITKSIQGHSLCRIAELLNIQTPRIQSMQAYVYKEWVRNEAGEFLLLFSHGAGDRTVRLKIRTDDPFKQAMDLSTGETFLPLLRDGEWTTLEVLLKPAEGRYLWLQKTETGQ